MNNVKCTASAPNAQTQAKARRMSKKKQQYRSHVIRIRM
jgi:hypothetical protein